MAVVPRRAGRRSHCELGHNRLVALQLCVLLWEHPGRADDLAAFEDEVLALLADHDGRLLARSTVVQRGEGDPLEVQLIELPDEAALNAYLHDPARTELARRHDRDAVIARTQLLRVEPRRGSVDPRA